MLLVSAVSVKATAVTHPAGSLALLQGFTSLVHRCLTQFWLIENAFFFFCQGKLSFEEKPFGQLKRVKLNGFNRTFLFPSVMEPTGLDCDVFLAATFKSFPLQAL